LTAAKLKQLELAQKQHQIHREISSIHENFNATTLKELADKEKQLIGLTSKSQEFEFRRKKQSLLSPVDGYIDEIFIHTQGGIITPAQRVLSIVPVSTPLIVEASVLNKDIGYVRSGMPAALKVETFDFQKYGMLDGKVIYISRYSHQDKAQGYLYTIWVKPLSTHLIIDGRKTKMQPGMMVTTEVKVGKRRIIEFFIYPLIKYMHEGLSVR
jgi:hemolysin D